jgi:Fic family protein
MFTGGTYEWITRVSKKHKQLMDMRLSSGQKDRLDRWAEIEFVHSTLKLEGNDVSSQLVTAVFENRTQDNTGLRIGALLDSYRSLVSLVKAKGKDANLTLELLLKLHTVPGTGLRPKSLDQNYRIKSEQLPILLESALSWYTADSFAELNPVEQSALVLLRLLDIQPFESENERTALTAASLFTIRKNLPPIIIKRELEGRYRHALDEASRMNTEPMVQTIASAVENSLDEMCEIAGKK